MHSFQTAKSLINGISINDDSIETDRELSLFEKRCVAIEKMVMNSLGEAERLLKEQEDEKRKAREEEKLRKEATAKLQTLLCEKALGPYSAIVQGCRR